MNKYFHLHNHSTCLIVTIPIHEGEAIKLSHLSGFSTVQLDSLISVMDFLAELAVLVTIWHTACGRKY